MLHHGPRGRVGRWAFLWVAVIVTAVPFEEALAQLPEPQPQEPPTFELPEVIVPGKRPQPSSTTPASVTVISRDEIERSGSRTVADALRTVPELSVRAYGGLGELAEPSIRGSSPAQVLVLLDGIPLNSVALGQTDLSTISVDAVERIEILRGPFAAIYGSGALGGVISIVTTKAARSQLVGRTGGFDQRSASLTIAGSHSLPWQLTISTDATGGHRINSDYAGMTLVTQVALSPDTRLLVHHYAADLGTPGDSASPTPNDRQSEHRTLLQVESGSTDRAGPRGRVYYVTDSLTALSASFGTNTYYSTVVGGEWQRVWEIDSQRVLTGGIEMQRQTLNAVVAGSPVVEEATIGAAYVQYEAAISDRAIGSLGVRLDSHSIYGTTLDPRAGIVYRLNDSTRLRAAAGRTFRGPTFLELFLSFPGCPGNPSLQPEEAWAGEIGVERQGGSVLWTATAFGTDATNLIVGGCPPQNVGAASIRGVSAEASGTLGALRVTANVTAMRAVKLATGDPLLRVPGVTASLAVHRQGAPSAGLSVLAAYVGPRPDVQFDPVTFTTTTVQMPGYVDLRIRYLMTTQAEWIVTLGVDNALDWQYEAIKGFPAPGRTIFATATKRF